MYCSSVNRTDGRVLLSFGILYCDDWSFPELSNCFQVVVVWRVRRLSNRDGTSRRRLEPEECLPPSSGSGCLWEEDSGWGVWGVYLIWSLACQWPMNNGSRWWNRLADSSQIYFFFGDRESYGRYKFHAFLVGSPTLGHRFCFETHHWKRK